MKRCVFCHIALTKANRAKERIIPGWLQSECGMSREVLSAGFGMSGVLTVERRLDMDSFLAGNVCAGCNQGWMSELETRSKPTIKRLLTSTDSALSLNEDERLLLSQWAIKTAIACNSAVADFHVSDRHIRDFDSARSLNPGRCGVFAGRLRLGYKFGYVQTSHNDPFALRDAPHELRIGLFIDGVVLLTAFVDHNFGYTFEIVEGLHEPIWPGRGHEYIPAVGIGHWTAQADLKAYVDEMNVRYRMD